MRVESSLASQIRDIEREHGRSMDDWAAITPDHGVDKHGLDHAAAHRIALVVQGRALALTGGQVEPSDPFDALYSGAKATLRPMHERLMSYLRTLGPFETAPKKGYVSLRRSKQFAMIQPGARWVNLGLVLTGVPVGTRLESAATFNTLFTHRVRLVSADDVDAELKSWIRQAYRATE